MPRASHLQPGLVALLQSFVHSPYRVRVSHRLYAGDGPLKLGYQGIGRPHTAGQNHTVARYKELIKEVAALEPESPPAMVE